MGEPAEKGWSFSLALFRTEDDAVGETALSWRWRLTPLDLALAAAAFLLLVVEPFAVYMVLTHYKGPLLAGTCAPSHEVVVVHSPEGVQAVEHAGGSAPGHEEGGSGDVITPLNVRDPANLVMTPYDATERARVHAEVRARAEADWREALKAANVGAAKAPLAPKPAAEDGK